MHTKKDHCREASSSFDCNGLYENPMVLTLNLDGSCGSEEPGWYCNWQLEGGEISIGYLYGSEYATFEGTVTGSIMEGTGTHYSKMSGEHSFCWVARRPWSQE